MQANAMPSRKAMTTWSDQQLSSASGSFFGRNELIAVITLQVDLKTFVEVDV